MSTSIVTVARKRSRMDYLPAAERRRSRKTLQIPRYIATRGTTSGCYEIERTIQVPVDFTNAGFLINAGASDALSFTFSMYNVVLYNGNAPGSFVAFPVTNAVELTALFDTYELHHVELSLSGGATGLANTASGQPPVLYIANDINDTASSYGAITQMGGVRTYMPTSNVKPFKHTCYPKFQNIVYYTTVLSAYAPGKGQVSTTLDVPHYGLKVGMNVPGHNNGSGVLYFSFKIYCRFKGLK